MGVSLLPVVTSISPEANFTLPETCDFLEAVTFVELEHDNAENLLKQYNEEGRKAGPPPDKRYDNRQGGFRGRGGGSYQRYDNRDYSRGGYQSRSGDGGSGYRGGNESKMSVSSSVACELEMAEKLTLVSSKKIFNPQATVVAVTTRVAGATAIVMEVPTHAVDIVATSNREEATIDQLLTTREDTTRSFILILLYKYKDL